MTGAASWWAKPRAVSVLVPETAWTRPYAEALVGAANASGDTARLCHDHADLQDGGIAFLFSWLSVLDPETLRRNRRNLVVHASALPNGRGFSPLPWQIIEGKNDIPVTLFEAAEALDTGPVVYQEMIRFQGHELIDELRRALGNMHVALCLRYLGAAACPDGTAQSGEPGAYYPRRGPEDSRLNPERTIADQFNLLRTVDNDAYPAFFEYKGQRYRLRIDKMKQGGGQ